MTPLLAAWLATTLVAGMETDTIERPSRPAIIGQFRETVEQTAATADGARIAIRSGQPAQLSGNRSATALDSVSRDLVCEGYADSITYTVSPRGTRPSIHRHGPYSHELLGLQIMLGLIIVLISSSYWGYESGRISREGHYEYSFNLLGAICWIYIGGVVAGLGILFVIFP